MESRTIAPVTTLTISMPESMREYIDQQVKAKGFGNTSEYLRSLVRGDQEAQAAKRLESLLLEGLESGGADIEMNPEFWRDLKAEALELARTKRRKISKR